MADPIKQAEEMLAEGVGMSEWASVILCLDAELDDVEMLRLRRTLVDKHVSLIGVFVGVR